MFEPETGFLVSGGSDAKIIVWDLGGEFLSTFVRMKRSSDADFRSILFARSFAGPGIQQKPLTKKHILGGHKQGVLDIAINKDYIVSW